MSVTFWDFVLSQIVLPSDLLSDNTATRNLVAEALEFILGGTQNALPNTNPLSITLSNASRAFTAGGSGQSVFAQGFLCDTCPPFVQSIAANTSAVTRTDLVSIQYSPTQINATPRATPTGSTTVYQLEESIAYAYNANTGAGSPPAGFVAFALISVPPGATLGTQCTVTYLFENVGALLATVLGGLVSSVNGASGAIKLTNGTLISVTALGGGSFRIDFTGASNPVTSVGGVVGGAVGLAQGSGIVISVTGSTITITNSGVHSINGDSTAAQSIECSDGSLSVNTSGGVTNIEYAPTQRDYGGSGTTNANSRFTVTVPYQVQGADGTVQQASGTGTGYPPNAPVNYGVYYDNTNSSPSTGVAVFFVWNFTTGMPAGNGIGIGYTVVTNTTPA